MSCKLDPKKEVALQVTTPWSNKKTTLIQRLSIER